MSSILDFIKDESSTIILFLCIGFFILFILAIVNGVKTRSMIKKYKRFMAGLSPSRMNIEDTLIEHIKRVNQVVEDNKAIEEAIKELNLRVDLCSQKVGIVRYSAFEDVGSDISFSVAILDAKDNGIVITGIYSRESSATYAKPIENSTSKYSLSADEIQAIEIAKKNYGGRTVGIITGKKE